MSIWRERATTVWLALTVPMTVSRLAAKAAISRHAGVDRTVAAN